MRRKPREVLVCDVCNAQFNDKNSLKHHAITHIEPPERLRRLHECRFCGKTFVKPIEKVITPFKFLIKKIILIFYLYIRLIMKEFILVRNLLLAQSVGVVLD